MISPTKREQLNWLITNIQKNWLETVPKFFKEAALENCPDLPDRLVQFGYDWLKTRPLRSLFISGEWGSGKTWFVFALIKELMRKIDCYFWPRYITGKELDTLFLKAFKHTEGDLPTIQSWADEQLLFIDEIEKVSKVDGVATERIKLQIFELINRRMLNGLPTILTSNCGIEEFGRIFDGSLVSRICDRTIWERLVFPKKDLRKTKVLDFSEE